MVEYTSLTVGVRMFSLGNTSGHTQSRVSGAYERGLL